MALLISLSLSSAFASAEERLDSILTYGGGGDKEYEDSTLSTSSGALEGDRLRLGLSIREEYNDNVRLTPEDEESDTATVIEPAVRLLQVSDKYRLNLRYYSSLTFYDEHDSEDSSSHVGEAEGRISLPARSALKLWVRDEYTFFQRDIREAEATRNQVEGNEFAVRPALRIERFEPVYLETGYRYQRRDYRHPGDGVEWEGKGPDLALGINFAAKLDISAVYQHFGKDFDLDQFPSAGLRNYEDDLAGVRLRCQVSAKLAGKVTYGRLWRDYKSGNDSQDDIWEGELILQLLDGVSLTLSYSQFLLDKVSGDLYEHRTGQATLAHSLKDKGIIRYGVFAYKDSYLNVDRTDEVWGARGSLSLPILGRFTGILLGDYESRTFGRDAGDKKNADYYIAAAELAYAIRDWCSAFIRYTRLENNVEDDIISDYRNNRYAIGLRFAY